MVQYRKPVPPGQSEIDRLNISVCVFCMEIQVLMAFSVNEAAIGDS